jgi:large subunit ribosomal protein L17
MRHGVAHRKLGRVTEHRIALLRNQAQALLRHERIETTLPKAKELRPYVERLISVAKRSLVAEGTDEEKRLRRMTAERLVARDVADKKVVTKLFDTLAPRFVERPGGYTRVLKLGHRRGDAAEVAQIELIGSEFDPNAGADATDAAGEQPKGLRGRARAAVKKLQDEGAPELESRPKRARKSAKKDE